MYMYILLFVTRRKSKITRAKNLGKKKTRKGKLYGRPLLTCDAAAAATSCMINHV